MSYVDAFMHHATHHAANFAFRSSITFGATLLFTRLGRYIESNRVKPDDAFYRIRNALDRKIKIISPSIELIETLVTRGNSALESITGLTSSIRNDIADISVLVMRFIDTKASALDPKAELLRRNEILEKMNDLLKKIEDSVPLISLAITTSGANMYPSLPSFVSPSILLKAHLCMSMGDASFEKQNGKEKRQIGPTFIMRMYSVFGASDNEHIVKDGKTVLQWKEEMAKCEVRVYRVPAADNVMMYELEVVEDLDDGRYHEELEELYSSSGRNELQETRGRMRVIPIYMITHLYFSQQGQLLHIEDVFTPVLVVKVNHAALSPQEQHDMTTFSTMRQNYYEKVKDSANVEWLSFEMYPTETSDISDSDADDDTDDSENLDAHSEEADNVNTNNKMSPADGNALTLSLSKLAIDPHESIRRNPFSGEDKPSLSLLEFIARLTALQTSTQRLTIDVSDEIISLFLRNESKEHSRGRSDSSGTLEQPRRIALESILSPSSSRASTPFDERKSNEQGRLDETNRPHSSHSSRQSTPVDTKESGSKETHQRHSRRSNRLSELSRKSVATPEQASPEPRPQTRELDETLLTPWEKHSLRFKNTESTPSRVKGSRRPLI